VRRAGGAFVAAFAAAFVVFSIALVTCGPTGGDPPSTGAAGCGGCVHPPRKATWWYQLQGRPSPRRARVIDVDGFDTARSFVSRLHAARGYAVCYVDVGTWERWRRDSGRFPQSVLGRGNGWPGERWLDIRQLEVLGAIMRSRMRMCRAKGFDAVEPDNVDGFANETGFPLSARAQLSYNRWIARTAHRLGLAVALKNDLDQAPSLLQHFDFAIVEQCFEFHECAKARPFVRARKAVFDVEYALPLSRFCSRARLLGINALRARESLSGEAQPCA
jgi:hypothetical protein